MSPYIHYIHSATDNTNTTHIAYITYITYINAIRGTHRSESLLVKCAVQWRTAPESSCDTGGNSMHIRLTPFGLLETIQQGSKHEDTAMLELSCCLHVYMLFICLVSPSELLQEHAVLVPACKHVRMDSEPIGYSLLRIVGEYHIAK